MSEYEPRNSNVLTRCLKTESDGADATSGGISVRVSAPQTGKVHLPTVARQKDSWRKLGKEPIHVTRQFVMSALDSKSSHVVVDLRC